MSLRGYRIIAGITLSGIALSAPDITPHLFEHLLSSASLGSAATQLIWRWSVIALFYFGGWLVGSAWGKRGPDSKRDETIKKLSDAASSFAAANTQWEEQFGRLAAERDELAARCAELTAERDRIANQLGQARAALSKPKLLPEFFRVLLVRALDKAARAVLHPDRAGNDGNTRHERELLAKQWCQVVEYVRQGFSQ
jgi:hypothetical protein